jgi:putative oxidoreductase
VIVAGFIIGQFCFFKNAKWRNMKKAMFTTGNTTGPLLLRIFLAVVLLAHGSQKLLGMFGGFGFSGTMDFFTHTMGFPRILGFGIIFLEFFGSIALLAGLATRPVSVALLVLMLGIIFTSHWQNGFFMNWFGSQKGEGFEYFVLYIGGLCSLMVSGGGKASVDRLLSASQPQDLTKR